MGGNWLKCKIDLNEMIFEVYKILNFEYLKNFNLKILQISWNLFNQSSPSSKYCIYVPFPTINTVDMQKKDCARKTEFNEFMLSVCGQFTIFLKYLNEIIVKRLREKEKFYFQYAKIYEK